MNTRNKPETNHGTDQDLPRKQGNGASVNTPKYADTTEADQKADVKRAS
jgi:hypothetical protein